MAKERKKSQKFEGYDKNYIADLLKIVSVDVQDNVQIEGVEYLQMAASSCEKFNEEFKSDFFDNGEK